MASVDQMQFLQNAFTAATLTKHPWPDAAAAEACAESTWGASKSVHEGNNLLGIHAPSWWVGGTFVETTLEQDGNHMVADPNATWSIFASWTECFRCQVEILERNKIYREALVAQDAPTYIRQVSAQWQQIDPTDLGAPKVDNVNVFKFGDVPYLWLKARWSTGHARAYLVYQIWKAHHQALIAPPAPPVETSIA